MRLSLLTLTDALFFVLFPLLALATAVWAMVSQQEAPAQLVSWVAAAGWIGVSIVQVIQRCRTTKILKFESSHRLWVGWTDKQYAVKIEDFDATVEELLVHLEPTYPLARQALAGCVVVFREPTWTQITSLRRVAGEQDGTFITVGWHLRLDDSALVHELAHRVLQICAGDPSEEKAHEVLAKIGL